MAAAVTPHGTSTATATVVTPNPIPLEADERSVRFSAHNAPSIGIVIAKQDTAAAKIPEVSRHSHKPYR